MATQYHQKGEIQKAEMIYRQVLQRDPDNTDALHFLGIIAAQEDRYGTAVELIKKAISSRSHDPQLHYNLGKVYAKQGNLNDAAFCYRHAVRLNPDFADAHMNLSNTLKDLGKLDEAILYCHRALALLPTDPEIHYNLGTTLMMQARLQEAVTCYRRALEIKPDFADAHDNLGNALTDQGKLTEAIACYRRALELKPDFAQTHNNLLLALNYDHTAPQEEIAREHRRFGLLYEANTVSVFPAQRQLADPERILRVGYVSADFRDHSCAYFFEPLLAAHDRAQLEIFCYSDVKSTDATTLRIRDMADHWRNALGLSDDKLAKIITSDRIDILVDLAGHTAGNRLLVFASRVASIQISWLGYPNTTGLTTMDYRLTDARADPIGATEHLYTERLIRLPESFLCYQPPQNSPAISALPYEKNGHITFGCFNNISKVTPTVVALWSEILRAVPNSKLILKAKQLQDEVTCQHYRALFKASGIPSDKLEMIGHLPMKQDHLAAYSKVDIALDPFPYNGTTTTCEALWMGVPVITLAGEAHAGRVGLSLLHTVGLDDLAAENASAYQTKAVDLANDQARLATMRQTLRDRVTRSPLCDRERFAKDMETAYRTAWKHWCEKIGRVQNTF